MGLWSSEDDHVYESTGWAGDDEPLDDDDIGWVEESRSASGLPATGMAAAIIPCLAFWLPVVLSYPLVEAGIVPIFDFFADFGGIGR